VELNIVWSFFDSNYCFFALVDSYMDVVTINNSLELNHKVIITNHLILTLMTFGVVENT
jgi:hypothetical protein